MTDRQKFWLKVVLFVTLPLWVLPMIVVVFIGGFLMLMWCAVSDIVDPPKRYPCRKRAP